MSDLLKHLDINHNHEAGLIPVATRAKIKQAADLLDECETFMGRTEEKDLDVCSPEWWTEFYRLFAKLRGEPPAQEKADEGKS